MTCKKNPDFSFGHFYKCNATIREGGICFLSKKNRLKSSQCRVSFMSTSFIKFIDIENQNVVYRHIKHRFLKMLIWQMYHYYGTITCCIGTQASLKKSTMTWSVCVTENDTQSMSVELWNTSKSSVTRPSPVTVNPLRDLTSQIGPDSVSLVLQEYLFILAWHAKQKRHLQRTSL